MKKRKKEQVMQENTSPAAVQEGEVTEEETEEKKTVVNTIVNIVLVVAIILAAVCTYVSFVSSSGNGVPSIFGIRPFSIQTDSMYPTLNPGDLIIDTAVKDVDELAVGDIITYWTVVNGERVLNTHRITDIYDGGGYRIYATKGDNNTIADPLTVHESEIVGKYSFKIGGIGKVFDYLQTSTGFLLVVVLPVFIFFLYHLVQFFRVLFEYQNIKNRILYEQERGKTEDLIEEQKRKEEEKKQAERLRMEEELRARLKAELMADLVKDSEPAKAETAEAVAEEDEPVAEVVETAEVSKEEVSETAEGPEQGPVEETVPVAAEEEASAVAEEETAAEEVASEEAAPVVEEKTEAEISEEAKQRIEEELRAKMEAELRAKMEAEFRAKMEAEIMEKLAKEQPKVEE